jgi:dihydrofolate reductase
MSTTLTVDFFSTLDGYGSADGWPGYWGKEGPELVRDRVDTFEQEQVLVFGATTFREFQAYVEEFDEPYYERMAELPKIVFSRTLRQDEITWPNSTVIADDAIVTMERLRLTTDTPLRCHGSISLNRAFLSAGLVDRIENMLFPAITGRKGFSALFHDGAEFDLDLISTRVLDGRTVKLVYAPHVHTGVPDGVGPQRRSES